MNLFDPNYLLASVLWSAAGFGYFIYGKRQQAISPMIAGALMMVVSFFVGSALLMSLICIALMVAVYMLVKRGY